MEFKSEINLISSFKENYVKFLINHENFNDYRVLEEVKLGFGVPDLVIGEISNIPDMVYWEPLCSFDISIYKILEKEKTVTLENVSKITGSSKRQITFSLKKLINRNYAEKKDSYYILNNKYELSFKKSIAIEAKLKNWKRALAQAYRYKWFADYSYVVLDNNYVNNSLKNISLFEKYNIGLISITPDGDFYEHYTPIVEKPIDSRMQILLSEKIYDLEFSF